MTTPPDPPAVIDTLRQLLVDMRHAAHVVVVNNGWGEKHATSLAVELRERLDNAIEAHSALQKQIDREAKSLSRFARFEMVQTPERSPRGTPRYRIYGIYGDGLMVEVDQLFLHDEALRQAEQRITSLEQQIAGVLREWDTDCDDCEDCAPLVMCSLHSAMSALAGRTSLPPPSETRPDDKS